MSKAKAGSDNEIKNQVLTDEENSSGPTGSNDAAIDSVNNDPHTTPTSSEEEAKEPLSLESVTLLGWEEGREGLHSVHIGVGIYSFKNGKAEFFPETAELLRASGYIE
ncbi:hypothetical protein [Paenibacillus graminis]|uniref:Uncharacterized protein n=1 Tax=Paenibacillus graminis TaxID=189425 RepID=A0A089MDC9_9BACL|nr:hypothetical protein [Paenibacillus graminis]AIQ70365.1 hypothetical protein PGRAT_24080 [Paenibacillus graminis]MEC0169727.1 hypothetical protein [Paenibacillus graminis]